MSMWGLSLAGYNTGPYTMVSIEKMAPFVSFSIVGTVILCQLPTEFMCGCFYSLGVLFVGVL